MIAKRSVVRTIGALRPWQISALCITLTELIVSGMSLLLRGYVAPDYLITGFVAALFVCYSVIQILFVNRSELEQRVKERTSTLQVWDTVIAESVTAFAMADLEGKVTFVNRAWLKIWGYDNERDVLGLSLFRLWRDREKVQAGLDTLMQHGSWSGELAAVRRDGAIRDLHLTTNLLFDANGRPVSMIGSFLDVTEGKLAEDQLRQFRALVEASTEFIAMADLQGRLIYLNPAGCKLLGLNVQEVTSKIIGDFVVDEDKARVEEEILPTMFRDGFWHDEFRFRHFVTGAPVPVDQYAFVISDQRTGQPVALANISHDITERKLTEEALRLSEERLGQAVRVSHIGIFDHDQRTDTIYWSPGQRKIYGWTLDEPVTLEKYFEHVYPEDRGQVMVAVRRAHDPKIDVAFDIEHRIIRRDGEIRWLSTRAQTFFEGEGEARHPVRTVGAVLDITDTKKASAELEFANNLLTTQIEHSPDGILVVDADRKVVLFNRRLGELWKIPQEIVAARVDETILRTGAEWVKDPEKFYARVVHLYEHPEEVATEDIQFKDGRIFERHSTPLRDFSGKYLGRLWIFHDITERKRTEDQIRQLQKMDAVGKLTGGVAHDFNNLLAIIGGNLELLEENLVDTPALHDLAEKARRAVERGATLTRSLLAFSRQQPLSPRVVDLKKLVQEMADLIRRTVPETIDIEVVAGTGLWRCEADPGQLQNALLNLVANARDAMPEGGKLTIETANARLDDDYAAAQADVAPGQYVMLAVSDTGQGMPPEVIARAFDPFFTTKGPGKGVGLGLSMVYGFAQQSNGYAKIYSEVGHGSTVRIYLPRSTAAFEDVAPTMLAGDINSKGETILVVEDDPDVRSLTCGLLRSFGYEVFEAGDPQGALGAVRNTPCIALLLIDVVLPGGMNGPKLAEEIRRLQPQIKVLYMSGYTENAVLHHGRLDPGVHLLQKPFTKRDLASKIRRLLEGKNF